MAHLASCADVLRGCHSTSISLHGHAQPFRASRQPPRVAHCAAARDHAAAAEPEAAACSRRALLAGAAAVVAAAASGAQPASAAATCSLAAENTAAAGAEGAAAASGSGLWQPAYAADSSAAAAQPVWELAAASGNIKQAPEDTSELLPFSVADNFTPAQARALELNTRIQQQNAAPVGFPAFVREGFNVKVLADGYTEDKDGLIYRDYTEGSGDMPADGQEVVFDYTAYNEQGRRIDTTYSKGAPARTRLGIQGLIPGFELGIKGMRVGGKRRIVVPPQLGPPTGPSTFFSAKQCEVFDVELRAVRNCRRRQVAMFSDVVCE